MEYVTDAEQRAHGFNKEKLGQQDYEQEKQCCLNDCMMLRFRKAMKIAKISWSDEKFCKSLNYDFWIERDKFIKFVDRPDSHGKIRPQAIMKSRNILKEWLDGKSLYLLSSDQMLRLEYMLGYQPEAYFTMRDHYNFLDRDKNQNQKKQYDICSHLKPGATLATFLYSMGYYNLHENGSYTPSNKWFNSPRVLLKNKLRQKEAQRVQKALAEQRKIEAKAVKDNKSSRLKSLKSFFGYNRWEKV